jgi:tetratricopeptide (TPR) repeat protein
MTRRYSRPVCRAPIEVADSHLVAERHELPTRSRLLAKFADRLDRKLQDPELFYLGARYAVSLGLGDLACRFLAPLSELLHDEGRPSPAFFPVGVLYLRALSPGDPRRDAVLKELRELAAAAPRLASLLACVGGDPQGRAPAGSPQRWLELVEQHFGESLWQDFAAPDDGDGDDDGDAMRTLRRLLGEAARDYEAGRLAPARQALEKALLLDGDQPEVLRNLVTVTSEQQDAEAYGRYWRRFVKLLLWRIMRGDDPWAAYHELIEFYTRVATVTDREFSESGQKIVERLRVPGLLPRWLEAHAALVWLDSVRRPNRVEQASLGISELQRARLGNLEVMRFWYRVFYPEFARFLEIGKYVAPPKNEAHGGGFAGRHPFNRRRTRLPFAPAERLLKRFAEWSKFQFGLTDDHGPHTEAVTALAGFVARIPVRPHARMLSAVLAADELNPLPLRRNLQQACSLPLRTALGRFLGRADEEEERKEDWEGLIEYYGDLHLQDFLTPDLRMFLAFAHCRCRQFQQALEIACHTLPDMQPDDLREDAQAGSLWKNVVRANLQAFPDDDPGKRQAAIAALKERIEAIPVEGPHDEFRNACVRELLVHEQVERAIRESQELAKQKKWAEAKKVVKRIPDDSDELKELKKNLLSQIDEAAEHSRLQERIEKAIEESKALVGKGRFREARDVIRRLPDEPPELKNLKKNLLSQIDEAAEHSRLQERIEKAIEESKVLVEKGKYREAKDLIRRLPDEPPDLKDLKNNLLSQIEEVEMKVGGVNAENQEILKRLAGRNVNWGAVAQIAKDNDLDMSNPFALNALLKAIEKQIRGW